ncbi:MAG: hypothetical protein V4548_00185 [Bacteroidota bacterium]
MEDKFIHIKTKMQEIIDLITAKKIDQATAKIHDLSITLNELLDYSDNDKELIEISRYQVLLNQLQLKINAIN